MGKFYFSVQSCIYVCWGGVDRGRFPDESTTRTGARKQPPIYRKKYLVGFPRISTLIWEPTPIYPTPLQMQIQLSTLK